MEIALKPNLSVKEMFCQLMMPDGSVVGLKDAGPFDGPSLAAKGLRLEMLEPDRVWRLAFAGGMERTTDRKAKKSHVELDLRFEALNDVFDYGSCATRPSEQARGKAESGRLEQVGRLHGRLSTGLDDFQIEALGERCHSWGVCDLTSPKDWTWMMCQFSESHAFGLTKLAMEDGVVYAGFVFKDGKNTPLVRADLSVNKDFAKNPMSFDMTLHDRDGGTHRVFGSVMKRILMQFKSPDGSAVSSMNETLSRYNSSGKTGYGIAEFLIRTE